MAMVFGQRLWTSADLELFPDDDKRYGMIDGALYVTRVPHSQHQKIGGRFFAALDAWSRQTNLGEAELGAGLILGDLLTSPLLPGFACPFREILG